MCEIFGFSGKQHRKLNAELKEFYSHSDKHPNGWGLALLDNGNWQVEKEPLEARKSLYLKERLSEPIIAETLLAHIRYATIGEVKRANSHPFVGTDQSGRRWILVHNGTIFDYAPMNHYVSVQEGDTDSERILLYLLDLVDQETDRKGHILTAEERFTLLDKMISSLSKGNKLNLLLYDGELLYVHVNFADSLYYRHTEEGITVSTQALSIGGWQPVPFTRLLAYEKGNLAFTGTNHGNEYIPDEEDLKHLYLAYSGL